MRRLSCREYQAVSFSIFQAGHSMSQSFFVVIDSGDERISAARSQLDSVLAPQRSERYSSQRNGGAPRYLHLISR